MRRVVRSSAYAPLLRECADFLASCGETEALVLAASRGAADDLVRSSCQLGFAGVHRTTLTGLAAQLAALDLAERDLAPMSQLSREAMAARVIHKLRDGGIPYFGEVAHTRGLAHAAAKTVSELRLERVDRKRLSDTSAPGRDLARILTLYEQELAESSLADLAILYDRAIAVARDGKHRLLGLPLVLVDVRLEFAAQRELLSAVIRHAPRVLATVLSGDTRAVEMLQEACGVVAAEDLAEAPGVGALDRSRTGLFSTSATRDPAQDASLDCFSAAGEGLECVEIARRILQLAREGIVFDDCAILLRSPVRYQPLVEEALRRAGIPAWFSRGVARPDPTGRAFLALLECAAERCSASRFAEYLSLGESPPIGRIATPEDPAPPEDEVLAAFYGSSTAAAPALEQHESEPEDADAPVIGGSLQSPIGWEKLLVDAAVIGGRDRWRRRLRGLENELKVQIGTLREADEGERLRLQRQLTRLKHLERFALPLVDILDELPQRALWGVWIERLSALARAALRRPESVLLVLDELQVMEDVGPVELGEVTAVLGERLRFLQREPPPRRYGSVFVASVEEARGRTFRVAFLPGLAEGLFPCKSLEDPLLLDAWRSQLDGLVVQDDRVHAERMLLRIALAAAEERLVFSYPRMDMAQSRPRVPSFYALEILRAAHGRLPRLREFEKAAAEGAPSRLDWPGPQDPKEAIDDAEYDLAALGPALMLPKGEGRAAGRYLIDASAHVARSLRTRYMRWRKSWSGADGLLNPSAPALAALSAHRLSQRSWSPSSLQQFAACPYRFLLHAVHQLRPREEVAALEQMDPLTRGALFHQVQFELLVELKSKELLPVQAGMLPKVLKVADVTLDRVADEFEDQLAPAIQRVWRSEVEDLRTDLRGWIQHMFSTETEWLPAHFEFSFGLRRGTRRDPASTDAEAVLASGVRLRGAIDLIEKHASRGTLRITDHKTGRAPERIPRFVGGGGTLQPLVYAMAAERLLDAATESSRLSYCTQRGNYQLVEIPVTSEGRQRVARVFEIIDDALERGFLPSAPQAKACTLCDYRVICGPYEELRTSRKSDAELELLEELRLIP
ncbi:MAG: PD-(D/E)XK nuclease family protein [Acidobacteriota bacterium]|nr:PD-(D/E)XK nuclease family protein [Acidobacteriota bacterium]